MLVVVGGAAGVDDALLGRLRPVFWDHILPAVEATRAAVVDGGTNAGVMRATGDMHGDSGWPLIGVIAESVFDADMIEAHHTDVLVVPGQTWGDESPWIAQVASVLAGPFPSVTLLVNGGEIAQRDVDESLRLDRRIIVALGTGRLADDLEIESDLISRIDPFVDGDSFARGLREALST